jgi:hypothetical protein
MHVTPDGSRNPKEAQRCPSTFPNRDNVTIINLKKNLRPIVQIAWEVIPVPSIDPYTIYGVYTHSQALVSLDINCNPTSLSFVPMSQNMDTLYKSHSRDVRTKNYILMALTSGRH